MASENHKYGLRAHIIIMFMFCLGSACVWCARDRCKGLEVQIRSCAPYTNRIDPTHEPSQECCDSFNAISSACLCALITGSGRPIEKFDRDRALGLPRACNLTSLQAQLDNIFEDCYNEGSHIFIMK